MWLRERVCVRSTALMFMHGLKTHRRRRRRRRERTLKRTYCRFMKFPFCHLKVRNKRAQCRHYYVMCTCIRALDTICAAKYRMGETNKTFCHARAFTWRSDVVLTLGIHNHHHYRFTIPMSKHITQTFLYIPQSFFSSYFPLIPLAYQIRFLFTVRWPLYTLPKNNPSRKTNKTFVCMYMFYFFAQHISRLPSIKIYVFAK